VLRFLRTWSFRLTLLYAALFSMSVIALFGAIYWVAGDYAAQDQLDELGVEFQAVADEAKLVGFDQLPRIIDDHLAQRAGTGAAYLLEDADGRKIAGNVPERPVQDGTLSLKLRIDGKSHRISAQGYHLPNGDYLLIGQDSASLKEMQELIARAFGLSVGVTLLLAVAGGAVISAAVLRRVESVSLTSRAIIDGDLSQRVPLRGTDDEFDHLAASVNAMLDRIEDLMRSMRQVSNDIAHDLRTPLTRLRQRLELARRQDTVEALREGLDKSTAQVDAILDTFGALLRIAQVEAGQGVAVKDAVALSQLLAGIAEDFAPSAEDRGQTLIAEIPPDLTVTGDRDLLMQMVVNLVENAIRHAPPGARITLGAGESRGGVSLWVADNGAGIPPFERHNVLRPFYRLESSRTTNGSGLGLSLVAAIARQHHAALDLADNNPGLRVTIRFPAAARD
jgi:signal transduction histidine kinase